MADLCTVADVEALSGVSTAPADAARVDRLIEMASALVAAACRQPLPVPSPAEVAMVTASLVVRQIANPTALVREGIAGYSADYGPGMELTEADRAALGNWATAAPGTAFYVAPLVSAVSTATPTGGWPVDWWAHDLDSVPW